MSNKNIGYPKECLINENPEYICFLCSKVYQFPVQTSCGHKFCKYCINDLFESTDKDVYCILCQLENTESIINKEEIYDDKAFNKELSRCKVKCYRKECTWNGLYINLEKHLVNCDFATEKCILCENDFIKSEPHECEIHKKCFLACSYQHDNPDIERVLKSICRHYFILQNRIDLLPKEINSNISLTNFDKTKSLDNAYEDIKIHSHSNTTHHGNINQIESQNFNIDENTISMIIKKLIEREDFKNFLNLTMKSQILSEVKKFVEDNAKNMSLMAILLEEFKANLIENEKKLDSNNAIILDLQRKLILNEATIKDLEIRLNYAEQTSYDGTLIWQITEFSKKKSEAVSGKITSIFSNPFYTSLYGYKMSARIYLNGDGMGKGTHLSLFFVIMRGKYDALLSWPFKYQVTMYFLDQVNKNHIVDAFKPDSTSSSFRQPTTEMNIASGCPLFVPLNKINESGQTYVINDTAYIKIVVNMIEGN